MVLREAYGLARPDEKHVLDWSDHLVSLEPALRPQLDVGRSFSDALAHLVDQCFGATYSKRLLDLIIVTPATPQLPPPVPQPPVAPRSRVMRGRRDRALAELHDLFPRTRRSTLSCCPE